MKSANKILPDFRYQYLCHSDINDYLDILQLRYSKLVKVKNIGQSHEGRILKLIRISTTNDSTSKATTLMNFMRTKLNFSQNCNYRKQHKPVILIDGGIHGREWCTISTALYCINQLTEHSNLNTDLLDAFDFVVVPIVNADGYEYSRTAKKMWRKSRRPIHRSKYIGVDCNRNFSFGWNCASDKQSSFTYRGEMPFSEPETKMLKYLMHSLKPTFYLTLHSFGKSIMYPYAHIRALPSNWRTLRRLARAGCKAIQKETGATFRMGNISSMIKNPNISGGSSLDYAHQIAKIPFTIAMELSGGCFQPSNIAIMNVMKESWVGIRAMCLSIKSNL